jgi:hypothetical protein
MPKWVIENCFGDETLEFVKGLDYMIVPDLLSMDVGLVRYLNNRDTIYRGSIKSMVRIKEIKSVEKYYQFIYSRYDYKYYSKIINEEYLLNKPIIMTSWGDTNFQNFDRYLPKERYFIRPTSGLKEFTGTTLTKKHWNQELKIIYNLPNSSIFNETEVIVCDYQSIGAEYRVVVCSKPEFNYGSYVVGISEQDDDKSPRFSYEAVENLVNTVCKSMTEHPDLIYVMDIACANGFMYVLEINHIQTSGLYGLNGKRINKILEETI